MKRISFLLALMALALVSCKTSHFGGGIRRLPAGENPNPLNPNVPPGTQDPNFPTIGDSTRYPEIFTNDDSSDPKITPGGDTTIPAPKLAEDPFNGPNLIRYPVDIIFLLDHSDSMEPRIDFTMRNLQYLISTYLIGVSGLDYRIFLVGDGPRIHLTFNDPRVARMKNYIGSHSALSVGKAVLLGQTQSLSGLAVRPEAVKELVAVTDDDSDEVSAADFIAWLDANPNVAAETHVHGLIAKTQKCAGPYLGFGSSKIGRQYMTLASMPRTAGVTEHICQDSASAWQLMFQNLGNKLREFKTFPQSAFKLSSSPIHISKMRVFINGLQVLQQYWQYLPASNEVIVKRPLSTADKVIVRYERA